MAGSVPTEAEEQAALVEYLEIKGYKFTSIPNNTYTKSWNQKRKNKEQGLRPGLPDLLVIKGNKLLFIEMKRTKGGTVSDVQKEWIDALNKIDDSIVAKVCKGFDEAKAFIESY